MKKIMIILIIVLFTITANAISPFAKWTKTELVLCNGVVRRTIMLPQNEGSFLTISYKPVSGKFDSFADTCTDFQFEVNDIIYSGRSHWNLINIQVLTDEFEGSGAEVKLVSQDKKIELSIKFLMYPNSPAIRKSLVIKNLSDKSIKA